MAQHGRYVAEIGMGEIRDSIVSESNQKFYVKEIFNLFVWLKKNAPDTLTDVCKSMLVTYEANVGTPDTDVTKVFKKNWNHFIVAIRECDATPLIVEEELTPEVYVDYARTLRKVKTPGDPLKKGGYGVKRSALFHLFLCHNGNGYSHQYHARLSNLFRGFYRVWAHRRPQRRAILEQQEGSNDAPNDTQTANEIQTTNVDQPINIANFGKCHRVRKIKKKLLI
jgi:hypothetical protein